MRRSMSQPLGLRCFRLKAWMLLLALLPVASTSCRQAATPATAPSASKPVQSENGDASPAPATINPALAQAVAETLAKGDQAVTFDAPPADDLAGGELVEELWDSYTMQGTPVGYARTTVAKVTENGRELIRTHSFSRTVLKRGGQTVTQDLSLVSIDTSEGELVRFASKMSSGGGEIAATGKVAGDQLHIEVSTLGSSQTQSIPWQVDWGGIFAPDQSLRRAPLAPGESRTVRSLLPIFNIPGDTVLKAGAKEKVDLPTGPAELLKVTSTMDIGGQQIETLLWVDDAGRALKSYIAAIGQESLRVTKEAALSPGGSGHFDLLAASLVPLAGDFPNPQRTTRVVYRAKLKSGQIEHLFPQSLSQRVKPIDGQAAEITVVAVRPDAPPLDELPISIPQPTDEDLAPNSLVQSDDSEVVKMAHSVAAEETDPWKLACALEKYVDGAIQQKNFSQAFDTAAGVARSREGDCTEHAVLLAALCRARKIPARAALGLVYYPPAKGFAYHMWNEVWIKDRWVPLDATLGLGGIGGDHLKLADSNLDGASAYSAMLPVIQVFGRLQLEVVEAE